MNKNPVYRTFRNLFRRYWLWGLLILDLVFYLIKREEGYLIGAGVILVILGLGKVMFRREENEERVVKI